MTKVLEQGMTSNQSNVPDQIRSQLRHIITFNLKPLNRCDQITSSMKSRNVSDQNKPPSPFSSSKLQLLCLYLLHRKSTPHFHVPFHFPLEIAIRSNIEFHFPARWQCQCLGPADPGSIHKTNSTPLSCQGDGTH